MEKREDRRNVSSRDLDGDKQTKKSGGKKKDVIGCNDNKCLVLQVKRKWSPREDGSPSLS